MRVDFSNVDDVQNFGSVPEGTYLCKVTEVRERSTRDGDPRWSFRLTVEDGEYSGRTAAWDGFSWSDRGMGRTKHVLKELGFETSGVVEVVANDLMGKVAHVQVLLEDREDPVTGVRQIRPRVPFRGYTAVEGASVPWCPTPGADDGTAPNGS